MPATRFFRRLRSRLGRRKKPTLPPTAQRNLDTILRVEQQFLLRRPWLERVGETISHFFGSGWFIAAHAIGIVSWIWWNLPPAARARAGGILLRRHEFDPYPFPLLSLTIGVEFILLTTFVLMNQKHDARRNEHWAHLHLQLSLLTEQEVTKNLQLLDAVARHLGVTVHTSDEQLAELAQPTSVQDILGALTAAREQVPAEGAAPPARAIPIQGDFHPLE